MRGAGLDDPPARRDDTDPTPAAAPSKLRERVGVLFILLVLAAVAWTVAANRTSFAGTLDRVGAGGVLLSLVGGIVGVGATGQQWRTVLGGLGVGFGVAEGSKVFFVSQLGKYLPGSVWPVLAQMEFGRRWGAPRRTMFAANILLLATVTATGLVTGAALLPWSSSGGFTKYWWTLLILGPLVVALHPATIPAVIDRVLAIFGREPLGVRATGRSMRLATAWGFGVWVLMGAHVLVLTHAFGAHGVKAVAAAVGGMALAWAVGLIFIPAPAGAGVREAVLVATFAPQIGTSPALAVALASRVLLLLADVVLAGVGAAVRPARSGRPGS
jgi:hypothetical protein